MESLASIVGAKFAADEHVVALIGDAAIVGPEWLRRERLLAIVQSKNECALFVLISANQPPTSFLNLSIERALPIDANFKYELDNGEMDTNQLYLSVSCTRSKFTFELKPGVNTATFVDALLRSIDQASNPAADQQFTWLRKYVNSKKDADMSLVDSPEMYISHRQNVMQGVAPMIARDNLIRYHTELKEREYTYMQPFNIFVGTWNVNGQPPPPSLKRWLSSESYPPDIYALGFQELDLSKEALLFDSSTKLVEAEWCDIISKSVDPRAEYSRLCVTRLVGMMLVVLIKNQYIKHVENLAYDTVGTGIMGKLGNKGGVSIRFDLHNTSLCFVNCHLAAHVEEYARRNQDFHEICNRTQFFSQSTRTQTNRTIKDHNQIYWLGDLNYRITDMDHITVKRFLDVGNIDAILVADQLKIQHSAHRVLNGYIEGPITFRPTYKYNPGTDHWDSSEKERAPAWCDRILWKGENIKQLSYQSYPELNISDHKPVCALFVSEVKVIDTAKYKKVHEEVIKKLDRYENEILPTVTVEPTEIFFDNVKYYEPQVQELCIANTGQVPVKFEFIKKLEESFYCKDWLSIEPNVKKIYPGEKCDVRLTIFVNEKSAYKLNLGEDKLYDILVLHLEGGKDIFIIVNGTYEKSCFGSSIETLIHLKAPVHDVLVKKSTGTDDVESNAMLYRKEGYPIPKELWYLVDHIYKQGLKAPNLFRYHGVQSEVWQIRDWLDWGSTDDMPGSIHSAVDALISLLKSTSEPIIPYNHHSVCLNASNNYAQCKQIIMQLPEYKRNVFLYLCLFLQEVLNYSGDNGTDVKWLAMLFGSIFLREPPSSKAKNMSDKRSMDIKKKSFVEHFLVNDQSILLRNSF